MAPDSWDLLVPIQSLFRGYPNYILTNPIRDLVALAVIAIAVLIFVVWGLRQLLRRRCS
jgi:uncharacterized protein HemY